MGRNPFFEKQSQKSESKSPIWTVFQFIVGTMVLIALLLIFVVTPNQINGFSMYPTFDDNELVLTNRAIQFIGSTEIGSSINYDYHRGDVIVFFSEAEDQSVVKRIIGIPGDTISISQNRVIVNGFILNEPYVNPETPTYGGDFLIEDQTYTLNQDEFFVLGDNRTKSIDSRSLELGPVQRNEITGKVVARIYPLDNVQLIGEVKLID